MKIQETYRNNGKGYTTDIAFEIDTKELEKRVVEKARKPLGAINLEDVSKIAFEMGAKEMASSIRESLKIEDLILDMDKATEKSKDRKMKNLREDLEDTIKELKFSISFAGRAAVMSEMKSAKEIADITESVKEMLEQGDIKGATICLLSSGEEIAIESCIKSLEKILKKYDD